MNHWWHKFWFPAFDDSALIFTRLAIAFGLTFEFISVFPDLKDLYGPYGIIQADLLAYITGWSFPLLNKNLLNTFGVDFNGLLLTMIYFKGVALLLFTLGLAGRFPVFYLWFTQVILMLSGTYSSYGVDRYFLVFLFCLLFVKPRPLAFFGNGLSTPFNGFATRYLQVVILLIYVDAGVSKSFGVDWWSGDAIFRALHLPEFHQFDFLWMAEWPIIPKVICWGTLFLEAFYIVGYWIAPIRQFWVLSIVLMHLGIAITMGLVNFGVTLALINIALLWYPSTLNPRPKFSDC